MSSFNSVSEALDLLVDPFDNAGDWDEIVRRAAASAPRRDNRPRQLRLLAAAAIVALAAALVIATPLGAAIGRALDGFGAWVTGQPGTPASSDEQKAFQAANARSWAAFAPGTELRQLLVTKASGATFALYGFRSGSSLCLRLTASGSVRGSTSDCAPLGALQTERTPAVVVAADEPFGSQHVRPDAQGYVPEAFSATFGIASDGVKRVVVRGDAGKADALIGGNAFLYVADHPKLGARVRAVDAVAADGTRVALPFASSPFGTLALAAPPTGKLHGPSRIERRVRGGTIGWIEHREPRGRPVPASLRKRLLGTHLTRRGTTPLLARVIQPDPRDFIRIGIVAVPAAKLWNPPQHGHGDAKGIGVCTFTITHGSGIGGGCSTLQMLFRRQPFSVGIQGSGPSQFSILSGIASDDVTTMRLFAGDGSTRTLRLTDNLYLARIARADYPLRLVAYNRNGKVIGIQSFADDGMSSHAPAAATKSVRTIAVIRSRGITATVQAGKPAGGFRCWSISFRSGASEGGCTPSPYRGPALAGVGALRPGGVNSSPWLAGEVSDRIKRVGITFADGRTVTINTPEGLVAYPIPIAELRRPRIFIALSGYDATGNEIAKHGMSFR